MNQIVSAARRGVYTAATVFILGSLVAGLQGGTEKFASGYGMAKMCAAVLLVGVGIGVPSLIYETRLSAPLKVLIHMGTGCLFLLAADLLTGWLRPERGLAANLISFAAQVGLAFLILAIQARRTRALARRMNKQLTEKAE